MKKILFPTDFSAIANNAFAYALEFAAKTNSEVHTLHTYEQPNIEARHMSNTLFKFYEERELEEFEEFKDSISTLRELAKQQNLEHVTVKHIMVEGDIVPSITHVANSEDYDLVIMGTKGATGLKEIFMGSKTAAVIAKVDKLVLAIPSEAKFDGNIHKIVFVTDYREDEKAALAQTIHFATWFDAEIHCLYFDKSHTEGLIPRMETWNNSIKVADKERVQFKVIDALHIEKDLSKYCLENEIDIIVMLTHKRTFFEKIFHYTFSQKMVNYLETPVLSIPVVK